MKTAPLEYFSFSVKIVFILIDDLLCKYLSLLSIQTMDAWFFHPYFLSFHTKKKGGQQQQQQQRKNQSNRLGNLLKVIITGKTLFGWKAHALKRPPTCGYKKKIIKRLLQRIIRLQNWRMVCVCHERFGCFLNIKKISKFFFSLTFLWFLFSHAQQTGVWSHRVSSGIKVPKVE